MLQKATFLVLLFISTSISSQKKYHISYYLNDQVKEEGWLENNQKIGYWKFFFQNGKKSKEGHYKNNKSTKYWYFYSPDSSLKEEGHFLDGKKNNWWLFYSKNGEINHKCQLKNNQKDGFCLLYQQKKLIKAEKYKEGKKINEWTDLESFKRENSLFNLD